MSTLVQVLQALAGVLWLFPAVYLSPRIVASWRSGASRTEMLSAPIGFFAWLQVGFTVRWLTWPQTLGAMDSAELLTWAALYALSALCAAWVLSGARQTRGQ